MRHRRENGPYAADQSENRLRPLLPAASLMIMALAALLWLSCSSEKQTATDKPSEVAQSADQNVAKVPPPEHYTGGPSIYFPEPTHDFGHIDQGDKVTYDFVVQNYGDQPLKLIKAKGS